MGRDFIAEPPVKRASTRSKMNETKEITIVDFKNMDMIQQSRLIKKLEESGKTGKAEILKQLQ